MDNTYLWSWNKYSVGARLLATALDTPRIRHTRSRFIPSPDRTIINWGSSTYPWAHKSLWGAWGNPCWLNDPDFVAVVSNKLRFFQSVSEYCRCVPWTVSQSIAQEWNQKSTVIVRNLLTGHSGNGILVVPPNSEVPSAPLYTRYVPKDAEYRVHIVSGEVIDTQRKIRNPSVEPRDWKIRSHQNGFIFVRRGVEAAQDVHRQALLAFNASGLDFAACDVIWNQKKQQAFVLELNSAPGLMGSTVTKYADALRNLIQNRRDQHDRRERA